MRKLIFSVIAAAMMVMPSLVGCSPHSNVEVPLVHALPQQTRTKKTMRAFRSDEELTAYFRKLTEEQKRERQQATAKGELNAASPAPGAAAAQMSTDSTADKSVFSAAEAESVTNVQHAGVDEGGIVKLHGDHLVVLRRGRLFTIRIGDDALRPVASLDAFGPEIDPRNAWYDEMLISADKIAVIGYSYERGGTEVGLFQIDESGGLRYLSTYHLRSNDYYSSRNYASRLVGGKLIFYTPSYFSPSAADPFASFPALRRWSRKAKQADFRRIVQATHVYRPERPVAAAYAMALHTVTVCDLGRADDLTCEATSVVGAPGRVFYVSPEAVYVWTSEWVSRGESKDKPASRSTLYRMPLDGSAPSALGTSGSPVDQFSFLESSDAHLNVLVRSDAYGDAMWGAEGAAGEVALMRVPVESFSDGSENVPAASYRRLPKPSGYTFQNRFVGDYLLYGTGNGWNRPVKADDSKLYAVRWKDGATVELEFDHGVDRIEAMGKDAMIVGTDGEDLHFTGLRLSGGSPKVTKHYTRKGASQGELRSHGFFYKAEGEESGVLGLPIRGAGRPGYTHLIEGSASVLFLRNEAFNLTEVGELAALPERAGDDGCRASCVDWYGNARPLFARGRVFALMGYEIVEGNLDGNQLRERRRVNFSPTGPRLTSRQ